MLRKLLPVVAKIAEVVGTLATATANKVVVLLTPPLQQLPTLVAGCCGGSITDMSGIMLLVELVVAALLMSVSSILC